MTYYDGFPQDQSADGIGATDGELRLAEMRPIDSETMLPSGLVLQTPNVAVLERLQAADSRVRYFPADMGIAQSAEARGYEYPRAVVDRLGAQVRQDFGDEVVAVRGTVASLTEGFPFFARGHRLVILATLQKELGYNQY